MGDRENDSWSADPLLIEPPGRSDWLKQFKGRSTRLSKKKARIRGGFVEFPGEETVTEEPVEMETDDFLDDFTLEDLVEFIEEMLFGDDLTEEAELTEEEYEELLLESLMSL